MKDNNKAKTIVVFDCRGLEPVDFSPRMGWKVGKGLCLYLTIPLTVLYNSRIIFLKVSGWKEDDDGEGGESGTVFEDVDLTDKEWADYDERSSPHRNQFYANFPCLRSDESTVISEIGVGFVTVK